MGLSKKGNVIVRGYVESPSVSKKGFAGSGWRTFRVDRMSNIKILEDETFDERREQYKDGEESKAGPMEVTYVTADWDSKQDSKDDEQRPEVDDQPTTSTPEPETQTEPTPTPDVSTDDNNTDGDDLPEPEVNKTKCRSC